MVIAHEPCGSGHWAPRCYGGPLCCSVNALHSRHSRCEHREAAATELARDSNLQKLGNLRGVYATEKEDSVRPLY